MLELKFMRITLITICLVFICCIGMAAAEGPRVGVVKNVSGQAFIERNKVMVPVKVKDELMENDVLVTGRVGSMGVILQDNSIMSIGSNTRLVISKFICEPAHDKLSFIAQIKKGTVVYLTGLIAKLNRSGVKFETNTVVCGVRGTHFAMKVDNPGD